MKKTFIYNFNNTILESHGEAFPPEYRRLKKEADAKGESYSRQVIYPDGRIVNECYHPAGIWLPESDI